MSIETLKEKLSQRFPEYAQSITLSSNELTLEIQESEILPLCHVLKDDEQFAFSQLMDLSGVDYLTYGCDDWKTDQATLTGFSRGVGRVHAQSTWKNPRFAVVYHLLSIQHNWRLRVRAFLPESLIIQSVLPVWASAHWYEREAFDLFGILFDGHPDLRRILTDYGFIGHPFRKDFPLSGNVEVRYDPEQKRVIYQPVSIEPRILVPKVIRNA